VKPSKDVNERYIDPEPLVAIWPLRMPVNGGAVVSTVEAPGVPLGAAGPAHRKIARAPVAATDDATAAGAAAE
jgi:hypothetical protein